MESLLIGVLGALIGAGASIATIWIQTKAQTDRERIRLVTDLAVEDHQSAFEMGKASGRPFHMPPVALYLHYHTELVKLMESGSLTPENVKAAFLENNRLHDAIIDMNREREETLDRRNSR